MSNYYLFLLTIESDTTLTPTCDRKCQRVYVDGVRVYPGSNARRLGNWQKTNTFVVPAGSQIFAVEGVADEGQSGGILASMDDGEVSDGSWTASTAYAKGWAEVTYCDEEWEPATVVGQNGVEPWGAMPDFASSANWIWSEQGSTDVKRNGTVYFR